MHHGWFPSPYSTPGTSQKRKMWHWPTQWCGDAKMSKTLLEQLDLVEVDVVGWMQGYTEYASIITS